MNEYLMVHESILGVGFLLVLLVVIFAGLFGYFKGKEDGREEGLAKEAKEGMNL